MQAGATTSRRASAFVVLLSVIALLLAGLGQRPADAGHETVTEVEGSAYGCFANTTFGGGTPVVTGPLPQVTLPPGGSATPIEATAPRCEVRAFPGGPIVISTGQLTVSTQGTTGPTGSVRSTATITTVGVDPNEAFQAAGISSSCTASEAGVSGSTTVTDGVLEVRPGVFEDVPENPAPNTVMPVDIGVATSNYIFNEQIRNADGSLTVNALRIQPLTGPLQGTVIIGQVVCGVTTVAQQTTTTVRQTTTTVPQTTTTVPQTTTTTTVPQTTTTVPQTTTTVPQTTTTVPQTTTTVPQTTTTVPHQTTTTVPQTTTTTTTTGAEECRPGQDGAKPGYGYGDKNHRHCGPPGQTGDRPGQGQGQGQGRGLDGRPVSTTTKLPAPWLLAGVGLLFLVPLVVPLGRSRRGDR